MLIELANIALAPMGLSYPRNHTPLDEKKKSMEALDLKEFQQLERARQIYKSQGAKHNREMIGKYVFRVWPHVVAVYAPGVADKLRPLIEKECPLIAAYGDKKLSKSVTTAPFSYE